MPIEDGFFNYKQGISPFVAVMMGVWTAILGGLLRDIICNEIPMVLQREIYISASVVGSMSYLALQYLGVGKTINEICMLIIIFSVRMAALRYNWLAPKICLNGAALVK